MSTIAERVAAGAAFLDEHDPDWWRADVERAINLGSLSLESTAWCVLGQRCPLEVLTAYAEDGPVDADRYWAYRDEILKGTDDEHRPFTWAADYGFSAWNNGEFDALTAEWRRVITERRVAS